MNKKWINNSWTITITGTVLGVLLATVIDYFKNKPFLTTISQIFEWIYNQVASILNFQISLWLVVIIIISIWIVIRIRKRKTTPEYPYFWNYRKDKFKTLTWKWDYENYNSKWDIVNLRPLCPTCETPLIPNGEIGYTA